MFLLKKTQPNVEKLFPYFCKQSSVSDSSLAIGADGLHAVMAQTIAQKRSRTVQGRERPFFYNPMWGRMGDSSVGAPGTYYYASSSYVSCFWNTFDQVLLRPELLDFFLQDDLRVISKIGDKDLMTESGISSSHSDHLPVIVGSIPMQAKILRSGSILLPCVNKEWEHLASLCE